ncbi:unnamed protein product [Cyprideis torosa]|uniref:Uncharacterized protein n=1 Tax=Cyprideis torosa TaxID=163714 RepID=A0A7R8ZPA4_9CRUS|nr:unnamed protein product [Cyprideis torosa]CAG0900056.1 unnamed protein product [Cyprideis torosa]
MVSMLELERLSRLCREEDVEEFIKHIRSLFLETERDRKLLWDLRDKWDWNLLQQVLWWSDRNTEEEQIQAVTALLDAGFDLNQPIDQGHDKWKPLSLAMSRRRYQLVQDLLLKGAQLNEPCQCKCQRENYCVCSLTFYLRKDFSEEAGDFLTALIKSHGVDPNCKNKFQETPLLLYVESQNYALAHILLDFGAEANTADAQGSGLYHLMAHHPFTKDLQAFAARIRCHYCPVGECDRRGQTPMSLAKAKRNEGFVQLMETLGAQLAEEEPTTTQSPKPPPRPFKPPPSETPPRRGRLIQHLQRRMENASTTRRPLLAALKKRRR